MSEAVKYELEPVEAVGPPRPPWRRAWARFLRFKPRTVLLGAICLWLAYAWGYHHGFEDGDRHYTTLETMEQALERTIHHNGVLLGATEEIKKP